MMLGMGEEFIGLITIVLLFGTPLVFVLGGVFLIALKILKGPSSPKPRAGDAEEAKMIQQIFRNVTGLEKRVDSLETILLDQAQSKKGAAGDKGNRGK